MLVLKVDTKIKFKIKTPNFEKNEGGGLEIHSAVCALKWKKSFKK